MRQDIHVTVLDVDSNRKYFAKHGYHLNGKGKTNACMQLQALVGTPYTTYDRSAIPMEWITDREEHTNTEYIEGSENLDSSLSKNRFRVPGSSRRTPHNTSEDFFMGNIAVSKTTCRNISSLIIYHQNIRGLVSKKDDLNIIMQDKSINLLAPKLFFF